MWYYWVIAGIILFTLEIFTFIPGFFLAGLGVACLIAAVTSLLHISLTGQLLVFALFGFVICTFVLPHLRKHLKLDKDVQKTGMNAYAGKTAKVIKKIENAENAGRIKVYEEEWKARSLSGEDIEENEIVVIKDFKDQTMYVEKT